jgi:hypothetical protein
VNESISIFFILHVNLMSLKIPPLKGGAKLKPKYTFTIAIIFIKNE